MFLNFKTLAFALLFSVTLFAQETNQQTDDVEKTDRKFGSLLFGAYIPISMGENFINNGFDLKPGATIKFRFNIFENFYAGPTFSAFGGTITDTNLVGNYDRTTNFTFGGAAGYEKQLGKWILGASVGLGYSIYANRFSGDNFNDTATALWISPELTYKFSSYFGAFIAPEYRHDFTNINAPSQLNEIFKSVDYLNISAGIRVFFGNGYKNP